MALRPLDTRCRRRKYVSYWNSGNTENAVCGWVMWLVGASVERVAVTSCLTPYPLFIDFPEAVGTISSGIRDITPLMEAE